MPKHVQLPPSDIERTEVLARLIRDRIEQLERERPTLTPTAARELYVLEQIRDEWLLEGRGPAPTGNNPL